MTASHEYREKMKIGFEQRMIIISLLVKILHGKTTGLLTNGLKQIVLFGASFSLLHC